MDRTKDLTTKIKKTSRQEYFYGVLGLFLFFLFGTALVSGYGFMYDLYIHTTRNVMGQSVVKERVAQEFIEESSEGDYRILRGFNKGEINESLLDSFYLSWPVKGGDGIVTQCFHDEHPAIDIADYRSPRILSAADGTVIMADCFTEDCPERGETGGEGLAHTVMIEHSNGYITVYGHLSQIDVYEGQEVLRGDVIGIMGKSGNVDIISDDGEGIHLHFALIKDISWDYLDPSNFLLTEICQNGEVDPETYFGREEEPVEVEEQEVEVIPLDIEKIADEKIEEEVVDEEEIQEDVDDELELEDEPLEE